MSIHDVIAPAVAEAERIEQGGQIVPIEVAALLRFNCDLAVDYATALNDEREYSARVAAQLDEALNRLNRLEHHLRHGIVAEVAEKLADYAGGLGYEEVGDPTPVDPFPDPDPAPKPRKRRKA